MMDCIHQPGTARMSKHIDDRREATEHARPLIDKYGRRYSQAVLRHWSPAMIKALDIRPITDLQEAKSQARA